MGDMADWVNDDSVDESDTDMAQAEYERDEFDSRMRDASDMDFEAWANRYDELNGGPEDEFDR